MLLWIITLIVVILLVGVGAWLFIFCKYKSADKEKKVGEESTEVTVNASKDALLKLSDFRRKKKEGQDTLTSRSSMMSRTEATNRTTALSAVSTKKGDSNTKPLSAPIVISKRGLLSGRAPAELLGLHVNSKLFMLEHPTTKIYAINLVFENTTDEWIAFDLQPGPQYLLPGNEADVVPNKQKKAMRPIVRELVPMKDYEQIVIPCRDYPKQRHGGLPFPENVRSMFKVREPKHEIIIYITKLMSAQEADEFFKERMKERLATLTEEQRKNLPKEAMTTKPIKAPTYKPPREPGTDGIVPPSSHSNVSKPSFVLDVYNFKENVT